MSYQYKFIKDGEWMIDDSLPSLMDPSKNVNNTIDIGAILLDLRLW